MQLDVIRPLTPLRLHLEVGANTVVLRHSAAEVNDTTLISALIWRLDARETELVGDVAADHFYHLMGQKMVHSYLKSCGRHKLNNIFSKHNEEPVHEWKYILQNTVIKFSFLLSLLCASWQLMLDQTHANFGGIFGRFLQGFNLHRNMDDALVTEGW